MTTKVSVLTVTQYSRRECFKLLINCILLQTVLPDEWVIVEGSKTKKDSILNSKLILNYKKIFPKLNIQYIPWRERTFCEMINVGNNKCSGDIIIQMEDDDYYPPQRIEHAINELNNNPQIQIAGCSSVYSYLISKNILIKPPFFGKNHSCNHALAYKEKYLENNKYDKKRSTANYSVETSFLNGFTSDMIQLDPLKTIIHIWHDNNTIKIEGILNCWKESNNYEEVDINILDRNTIDILQNKYAKVL